MPTQAELECRRALAKLKLERQQQAREADRERREAAPNHATVIVAACAMSLLALFVGVSVLLHILPVGSPPLQPIPSTTTPTTTPSRPSLKHGDECGPGSTPGDVCVQLGPMGPPVLPAQPPGAPPINECGGNACEPLQTPPTPTPTITPGIAI
jgi:hypothetical protein